MSTNYFLGTLMALAIIGLIHSLFTEWKKKRSTEEFAVKGYMKKLQEAGATDVLHANETGISFTVHGTFHYLDGQLEPATTLYSVYQLDDTVDLDTAKSIAFLLASSCEALSIQVKDTREIIVGCTTIIPDARSLWAVTPYMLQFLVNAMDFFCKKYDKEKKDN